LIYVYYGIIHNPGLVTTVNNVKNFGTDRYTLKNTYCMSNTYIECQ